MEPNTTKYEVYFQFLNGIANITYENLEDFVQFVNNSELTNIKGEEMAQIARKVIFIWSTFKPIKKKDVRAFDNFSR